MVHHPTPPPPLQGADAAAPLSELLLRAAGDGIFAVDMRGVTTYVNAAAARLLGRPVESLVGRPHHETFHAAPPGAPSAEGDTCAITATLRDGAVRRIESESFTRGDGSRLPVEYVASPVVLGGVVSGAVVVFRDVTTRLDAWCRLHMLESVVRLAEDAVVITDAGGEGRGPVIAFVNEAFSAMTGYPPEEVVGRDPSFLQGPETDHETLHAVGAAVRRGEPVRAELVNYRKDGRPFWVEFSITPVKGSDGRILQWASIQRETTARRQLEEQVSKARDELERTLDRITDYFVAFDRDFRFTYANRKVEQLLGIPRGELIGHVIWERFPATIGTAADHCYHLAMETQEPVEFEYLSPISHRLLAFKVYPSPQGLSAYARDVHDERLAQLATQQSELRYRSLFENSMDAILLTSPDGSIHAANAAACELFQRTEDEIRRVGRAGVTDPTDPALARMLEERARTGRFRGEVRAMRSDGTAIPVEVSSAIFRDLEGREQTAMFIRDLTARKRAAAASEALAEAGRFLAAGLEEPTIVESVLEVAVPRLGDAGLVHLVADGPVGRGCGSASGRCPPELVAIHGDPITAGRDLGLHEVLATGRPVLVPALARSTAAEARCSTEQRQVLCALGVRSLLVVPIAARGVTFGALTLFRMGTSRPFDAEDVGVATAVAGRAALALENARLFESQRLTTQLRDEVLAVVSHDLRNPINAVALDAQFLARRLADAPGRDVERETLQRVFRSIVRAERLIRDLLDVAALEAGRVTLAPTDFALGGVVEETVALSQGQARERGIALSTRLAPDLPTVHLDRDRLQQILENLISNALKFTPEGGHVVVGAEAVGGEVRLCVDDDGPGIAPDDVPHLFERFWQATAGRHGVGLGLPIARGLVEAQGGRIEVETALGEGTTMHVILPVAYRGP